MKNTLFLFVLSLTTFIGFGSSASAQSLEDAMKSGEAEQVASALKLEVSKATLECTTEGAQTIPNDKVVELVNQLLDASEKMGLGQDEDKKTYIVVNTPSDPYQFESSFGLSADLKHVTDFLIVGSTASVPVVAVTCTLK